MKPQLMDSSGAEEENNSEDEISVGCPSPTQLDDLSSNSSSAGKEMTSSSQQTDQQSGNKGGNNVGVRSFSILDILNHRPTSQPKGDSKIRRTTSSKVSPVAASPIESPDQQSQPLALLTSDPPALSSANTTDRADSSTNLTMNAKSIIMRPWDYSHLAALPAHFQVNIMPPKGYSFKRLSHAILSLLLFCFQFNSN